MVQSRRSFKSEDEAEIDSSGSYLEATTEDTRGNVLDGSLSVDALLYRIHQSLECCMLQLNCKWLNPIPIQG